MDAAAGDVSDEPGDQGETAANDDEEIFVNDKEFGRQGKEKEGEDKGGHRQEETEEEGGQAVEGLTHDVH